VKIKLKMKLGTNCTIIRLTLSMHCEKVQIHFYFSRIQQNITNGAHPYSKNLGLCSAAFGTSFCTLIVVVVVEHLL